VISLTFTNALILFVTTLTPIYLVLLILSERGEKCEKPANNPILGIITVFLIQTEVLTLFLLHNPLYRTTLSYKALTICIGCSMLIVLRSISRNNRQVTGLSLIIMYHIILIYNPPPRIFLHEGGIALTKLFLEGRWDPNNPVNPIYGPFPMLLGLYVILSEILYIPITSPMSGWIISRLLIVIFDLALYRLIYQITNNRVAGVLAIFLFALTPPTNLLKHVPKWTAILLVLISISALINAFKRKHPISNHIMAIVSYSAAIFYHPASIICLLLLLCIIVVSNIMKRVSVEDIWKKFSKDKLFYTVSLLFAVITLVRSIYSKGYLEIALPPLRNFILTAWGYSPAETYTPVYEQSVSWINAYAWSTVVAMASAYIIYSLLKKTQMNNSLLLFMYSAGSVFIFIGWLFAVSKAVYGSFRAATYVAFTFLVPCATVTGEKILKSSKILSFIFIVLIVSSTGVALTDPMLSPLQYVKSGAQDIPANENDYVEACFLIEILPRNKSILVPSEISSCFGYLTVAKGEPELLYYKPGGAENLRQIINEAIYNKRLVSGVLYIWPERWHPSIVTQLDDVLVNVYYSSERHVIFEKI